MYSLGRIGGDSETALQLACDVLERRAAIAIERCVLAVEIFVLGDQIGNDVEGEPRQNPIVSDQVDDLVRDEVVRHDVLALQGSENRGELVTRNHRTPSLCPFNRPTRHQSEDYGCTRSFVLGVLYCVMVGASRPLEGLRVGLVCSDRNAHRALCEHVEKLGGTPLARAILGDVAAVAEQSAIIVVFVDGYEAEAIHPRLESLERWHDGPAVIVVTDNAERSWRPSLERDRPVIVATSSEWMLKLVAIAAPPTEPELPSD